MLVNISLLYCWVNSNAVNINFKTKMPYKFFLSSAFAALTLMTCNVASAQQMELRSVMQDMSRNLQAVVDAISREEWGRVAELSSKIELHQQPSDSEKTRIITFFGPEMGRFKAFDTQTSEAASRLQQFAKAGQPQQVIDSVAKLQTSCLGCHEAFRERFINRFYLPDRKTKRD